MRKDHKLALAVCINKQRRITEQDLSKIYLTKESRKNALRHLKRLGHLEFDTPYGLRLVDKQWAMEALK